MFDARLRKMVIVATVFSLGHHLDHIVRGNHVGWPLTPNVSPFTWSLLVYPLVLLGCILHRQGRVGAGYWAILAGLGAVGVALVHFGPLALEPPQDIVNVYSSRAVGWFALAWLVGLIAWLAWTSVYSTRRWRRR